MENIKTKIDVKELLDWGAKTKELKVNLHAFTFLL